MPSSGGISKKENITWSIALKYANGRFLGKDTNTM